MKDNCTLIDRLRGPKIFNMAVFDWVATIIGACIICYFYYGSISLPNTLFILVLLILVAIIVHYIFKIPTMLNAYLGLNSKDSVLENRKSC